MMAQKPVKPRPEEKKIYLDDGAQIGRPPVDEKFYVDDGARIGRDSEPGKKKKS